MIIGKKIRLRKIVKQTYPKLNGSMEKVLDHGKEKLMEFSQELLIFITTVKCQISTS